MGIGETYQVEWGRGGGGGKECRARKKGWEGERKKEGRERKED